MNLFEHANSQSQQGNIGHARAIYELTRLGYTILAPLTDINAYDLVIEKDRKFQTVQVKTTSCRFERETRNIRPFMVNLKAVVNLYDLLFVMTVDGACYLIPSGVLPQHRLALTAKYDEYRL